MPTSFLATRTVSSCLNCAIKSLTRDCDRSTPRDSCLEHAATLLRTVVRKSYLVREISLPDKVHNLRLSLSSIGREQGKLPLLNHAEKNTKPKRMPRDASSEQRKYHTCLAKAAFSVLAMLSAINIVQGTSGAESDNSNCHTGECPCDLRFNSFTASEGRTNH